MAFIPPTSSPERQGPLRPSWFRLLPSLRGYRSAWLKSDVSAGLAIAAVGIPSAIAYPAIAGLPAETGIYASIGSVIGYALLGPSRRLIVGPDAATMAVLAGVLATILQQMPGLSPADLVGAASLLSLGVGLICFAASAFRLGNIASLLSRPILAGFFIGVAISIMVGQIGRVTGLKIEAEGLIGPLVELARNASDIHWPSLVLALAMFAILQLVRIRPVGIPGPVIVVVLGAALSAIFNFEARGIRVVGNLPTGLPSPGLPRIAGLPLTQLFLGSAAIFVVSFGAGIITARSFAARTGEDVDPNAELRGFGAANIVSSLLGGFAVTSSDSRTAVNLSVGGRTQLAGLTAAVVLALAVAFFAQYLRILPIPALGAILIAAALSVIDLDGLREIWRISRVEFGFALIAMAGAISFGVLQGVVVAIIATFVYVIFKETQPRVALLGQMPGRGGFYKLHRSLEVQPIPGLLICFVQGNMLFFNADHVDEQLRGVIAGHAPKTRWLVIDASAITQIDSTAVEMLENLRRDLEGLGIRMGLSEVQSNVSALLERSGFNAAIGREMIFDDLDDALRAFQAAPPGTLQEDTRPSRT
ncbi:SulP family inorganic anion transporter [Paracoccus sp. MBLB3053]|uniref:SulP family inorganic anion transporter n=1 Tax=Paracoccus aurantius TaxID=3073814 RepID=A0ABU2HZ31_9RHOB|nr:SulP family inorganic anion transporter [Paracoccus sp. MBLB3053]MDS9469805.1 SulP family inorganic anion transporter [Paracoccus sp. MBLB3053]